MGFPRSPVIWTDDTVTMAREMARDASFKPVPAKLNSLQRRMKDLEKLGGKAVNSELQFSCLVQQTVNCGGWP